MKPSGDVLPKLTNAVSLFAGIGGFDLALGNANVKVVATCEIDKQARGVLAYHWPNIPHFGDVRQLTGKQLLDAGFQPETGMICGGAPCQSFSVAGKQLGLNDPRGVGNLFWEMMRLAQETQSRWVLLENVPGLITIDDGETLKSMIATMRQAGYSVDVDVLDSQNFGVAQRRRRLYLLGERILPLSDPSLIETGTPHPPELWTPSPSCSYLQSVETGETIRTLFGTFTDGGGAAVTPTFLQAEQLQKISDFVLSHADVWSGWDWAWIVHLAELMKGYRKYAQPFRGKIFGEEPGDNNNWAAWFKQTRDYHASLLNLGQSISDTRQVFPVEESSGGNISKVGGQGETVTAEVEESVENDKQVTQTPFVKTIRSGARDKNGNLPPDVWEHQETAPTQNLFDVGETRATVLVVVENSENLPSVISDEEEANIEAEIGTEIGAEGDGNMQVLRRLTPRETEKLQGFPTGWTKFRVKNHVEGTVPSETNDIETVEQADGSRYKQLGNAVTVNTIQWIAERINASR